MKRFRILDIDNCIADDAWRIPRIRWDIPQSFDRYHEYHSLSPWDRCFNVDLFTGIDASIIICTGRSTHYRAITEEWLGRHGVRFVHLLMRNDTDHRRSLAIKSDQLDWLVHHYKVRLDQIEGAYDDRPDVIGMYRQRGLPAHLRFIHNILPKDMT